MYTQIHKQQTHYMLIISAWNFYETQQIEIKTTSGKMNNTVLWRRKNHHRTIFW